MIAMPCGLYNYTLLAKQPKFNSAVFPCYAWALKPLGWLPYHTAYVVWEVLLLAAFVGFITLWPGVGTARRWLVCCWSLPAFVSLVNAQGMTSCCCSGPQFAARLVRAKKPWVAGMVLALCASKFHLFGLVPLVILAQRRWRMAGGVVFGASVLLALSFAVAGQNWPLSYFAVLTHPGMSTGLDQMPNLHSLLGTSVGMPVQIALGLIIAACLFSRGPERVRFRATARARARHRCIGGISRLSRRRRAVPSRASHIFR